MDALSLLREYTIAKKEVVLKDGNLIFEDRECPADTPTNFKSSRGQPYTAATLWYLLQKVDLAHPKYIIAAKNEGFAAVTRIDRKEVIGYLTGEIDSSAKIDVLMTTSTVDRAPTKRAGEDLQPEGKRARTEVNEAMIAQDKERLAQKISGGPAAVSAADIQPLNKELTSEKLAEIKAKRLAKKHATISSISSAPMHSQDRSHHIRADAPITRDITGRERIYETRLTILKSRKPFDSVLQLLQSTRKQEAKEKAQRVNAQKDARKDYDRYNQPAQLDKAGAEFGINVEGSYVSNFDQTAHKAQATKKKKKPEKKKRESKTPIIIVPAGAKSFLSIHNIKKFLEDGKFVPTEEAMQTPNKDDRLVVNRKMGSTVLPYRVVDNVKSMTKDQWKRVICVFADGPAWQFRGWPFKSPVEMFAQVRGFHVMYAGEKIPKNISGWDVCVLELSRSKRHLDPTAVRKFWDVLDAFTRVHRPELRLANR